MKRVIIESPYAGRGDDGGDRFNDLMDNIKYAQRCMADALSRGEAPFASHLLYTQEGILDDDIPEERALGIEAGLIWGECADQVCVYVDRGITKGMVKGVERAIERGTPVNVVSIEYTDRPFGVNIDSTTEKTTTKKALRAAFLCILDGLRRRLDKEYRPEVCSIETNRPISFYFDSQETQ